MSGIRLLVADWYGVYVPQKFVEMYDTDQWGIPEENAKILEAGPDENWYWDEWDNALISAKFIDENGHEWQLSQDGDLWAYCEALMSDEEYENFFGERREEAA